MRLLLVPLLLSSPALAAEPALLQSVQHPNARWAVYADSQKAVAVDYDGAAAVLVPRQGSPRTVRFPGNSKLSAPLVTPEGRTLAVGLDFTKCQVEVAVWDVTAGKAATPLRGNFIRTLGCDQIDTAGDFFNFGSQFTPDGRFLLSLGSAGLRRWDARTGQPLRALPGTFFNISVSPDGRSVAALGHSRRVEVWTSDLTRRLKVTPQQPADCFRASGMFPSGVAWSFDSTKLAFSCDREVRVWNVVAGGILSLKRDGKRDAPDAPTFSPDGRFVAADEDSAGVAVWNVVNGQRVTQIKTPGPSVQVTDVAITPQNVLYAGLSDGQVVRRDLERAAAPLTPWKLFSTTPNRANVWLTLAVSREGDRLLAASGDGRVNVYRLPGN